MKTDNNNQLPGTLWMLLHCLLISTLVTIAKYLGNHNYSEGQIVFFHSFIGFIIILPFSLQKEGKKIFETKALPLHLARGVIGTASLFLYFYALKFMPLTDARAIALFSPIITFIFAVIFLKEHLNYKKTLALLTSLIGGYIIINPGNVTFHFMSLLILFAMIMWSVIDLIIKKLSKTESALKQLFYLSGLTSLCSFPFAISNWRTPSNSLEISLLILIGIVFLCNSLAIFLAIKNADLTTIMPFDFSGMIFTAIISYFVFAEIMKNNTLIGAIIIFLSSLYLIYHESKSGKELSTIAEGNYQKE